MPQIDTPSIPVLSRQFGSWRLRVERQTLPSAALAAAYDKAAPRWTSIVEKFGYAAAYRRLFRHFADATGGWPGAAPLRVLDAGVGTGAFSLALREVVPQPLLLTATDLSLGMLAQAKARFAALELPASLLQADVRSLPFADSSFDLVIAAHVLEHLPDPVAALAGLWRVLRPGGWLVTCLTRESWLGAFIQAKWRTHRLTGARARSWLQTAGFHAWPAEVPTSGIFRLTSLASFGQKPINFPTIEESA